MLRFYIVLILSFLLNQSYCQQSITLHDLKHFAKDFHFNSIWDFYKYNDLFYQNRKYDQDINPKYPVLKIEEYLLYPSNDTINTTNRYFNEVGDADTLIHNGMKMLFKYRDDGELQMTAWISGGSYTETRRINDSTFHITGTRKYKYSTHEANEYIQYSNGVESHFVKNDTVKNVMRKISYKNGNMIRYESSFKNGSRPSKEYDKSNRITDVISIKKPDGDTTAHTQWFYDENDFVVKEILTSKMKSRNWEKTFEYEIQKNENGLYNLKIKKIKGENHEFIIYHLDKNLNWILKENMRSNGDITWSKKRVITYRD